MEKMDKTTIKDVARVAGTSISTVSKVINGHYSISEKTAAHVKEVMKELNYYPNANAQSFAKGTTKIITVLTDLSVNAAFKNPHLMEMLMGLEEYLGKKNFRMVIRGVDATNSYEVAEEIVSRKSADALVIHVSVVTHPLTALLTRLHFPHIILGAPNFESQACWIDNNNVYSGTVAGNYLLSAGYKNIAFVGGQYYDLGSTDRLSGLKLALQESKNPLQDRYIWLGESTRADGYRMTKKLLEEAVLPDAIVCANNYIALGCVAAVQESGLKIPKDMGIVAFDDYPFSQIIEPTLTVVDINVREMGVQAGKFLMQIIKNPNMQIQTYITISNLIVRESTKNN